MSKNKRKYISTKDKREKSLKSGGISETDSQVNDAVSTDTTDSLNDSILDSQEEVAHKTSLWGKITQWLAKDAIKSLEEKCETLSNERVLLNEEIREVRTRLDEAIVSLEENKQTIEEMGITARKQYRKRKQSVLALINLWKLYRSKQQEANAQEEYARTDGFNQGKEDGRREIINSVTNLIDTCLDENSFFDEQEPLKAELKDSLEDRLKDIFEYHKTTIKLAKDYRKAKIDLTQNLEKANGLVKSIQVRLEEIEQSEKGKLFNDLEDAQKRITAQEEEIGQIRKQANKDKQLIGSLTEKISTLQKENESQNKQHKEEVQKLKTEFENRKKETDRNHADEIEKLRSEQKEVLSEREKKHVNEIAQIKNEFENRLSKKSGEYEAAKAELMKEHELSEKELREEIVKQKSDYESQISQITASHKVEIDNLNSELKSLDVKHTVEIAKTKKDYEDKIAKITKEYETAKAELEHEHKLSEKALQEEILKKKNDFESRINKLSDTHKKEIEKLISELESLKKKHETEIIKFKEEKEKELSLIKKEKETAIIALKRRHESEISEIQSGFESKIIKMSEDHKEAVDKLEARHQEEVQNLQQMISESHVEIDKLSDTIEKETEDIKNQVLSYAQSLIEQVASFNFILPCNDEYQEAVNDKLEAMREDVVDLSREIAKIGGALPSDIYQSLRELFVRQLEKRGSVINRILQYYCYSCTPFLIDGYRNTGMYFNRAEIKKIYEIVVKLLGVCGITPSVPTLFMENIEEGDYEEVSTFNDVETFCPGSLKSHINYIERSKSGLQKCLTGVSKVGYTLTDGTIVKSNVII